MKQTSSSKVSNSNMFSNKSLRRDREKIINKMAQAEENRTIQQADEYKSDTSDEEVRSNNNVLTFFV